MGVVLPTMNLILNMYRNLNYSRAVSIYCLQKFFRKRVVYNNVINVLSDEAVKNVNFNLIIRL